MLPVLYSAYEAALQRIVRNNLQSNVYGILAHLKQYLTVKIFMHNMVANNIRKRDAVIAYIRSNVYICTVQLLVKDFAYELGAVVQKIG